VKERKNHSEANSYCQSSAPEGRKGYLVSFETAEEWEAVKMAKFTLFGEWYGFCEYQKHRSLCGGSAMTSYLTPCFWFVS
jgi:hypothetical protein